MLPGSEATLSEGAPHPDAPAPQSFELEEWTIAQLQEAMRAGKLTSRAIIERYLQRIEGMDRKGVALHHVIETNPEAAAIAARLDDERKAGKVRGPLHGVPVVLKDNIDTADRMHTSAGSLALAQSIAPSDSGVAERLRNAGAVLLAKANLSEWANIRSLKSTSGWSARGGQGKNPYALDRTPCGSSSGSAGAVAASYCAVAVGTETDGSIVCPSSMCSVVGVKPTVGLISRAGIIPISHSQDTAGPIARTVTDAAILLGALTGEDGRDAATAQSRGQAQRDYTSFLQAGGLKGARIGVARAHVTGYSAHTDRLFEEALSALASAGAVLVDPADIPHYGEYGESEDMVLYSELKADLNAYLAGLPRSVTVRTLEQLIQFNEQNRDTEMPWFGQEGFLQAQEMGPLTSRDYREALARNQQLSRTAGLDAVLEQNQLDALVAPTAGPPWPVDLLNGDHFGGGSSSPCAVAGYPAITVPMGYAFDLPIGLTFMGRAWSEGTLLKLAFAYEQTVKVRKPPRYLPTARLPGYTV